MFSPSGRVSHFSGRRRIEDVFTRYIDLPNQQRDNSAQYPLEQQLPHTHRRDIQNKECLRSTLQQLRSENDIALQLANPGDINSEIEELQQEVIRLHQQLQITEEQIRAYEADPLKMTSIGELESCEKHLLDTLTHVVQRKEYLLSNHISSYDPSGIQGMPTSFENVGWLPEGGQNHPQIFDASAPNLDHHLRDLSSAVYDPFSSQGTSSNAEPQSMVECQVTNPTDGNLQAWPQGYTSLYTPPIQHDMVGPDMPDMLPHGQVNIPINNEAAEYECKPHISNDMINS
ncbi:hypothetical protein L6164_030553 [Bauhinia variegata]|uniref:Uncharacterized protein n=1 Tax=Bauhinia variegata TaxID=167791 RepID=A0ACB9LCR2_BAUVA|nr:hypothetical protein L6164_030553 [Bauhinia variegata]